MAAAEKGKGEFILRFTNCQALKNGRLVEEDVWVRNGVIIDGQKLFYGDRLRETKTLDCLGGIVAPGFIDVQINGAFGKDFSSMPDRSPTEEAVRTVAEGLLQHGVTGFCPTVVTSSRELYRSVLPKIQPTAGGHGRAAVLGVHVEGPFISREKKGAHREVLIWHDATVRLEDLVDTYASLDNIKIVTVAPEIQGMCEVIRELCSRKVVVSVGHSTANLEQAEEAVRCGASFITHLFNAMLPFHHRDPGIVGLLSTDKDQLQRESKVFYGVIADGVHTHAAALHLAQHSSPEGIVLVSDSMAAAGLGPGRHWLGTRDVTIAPGESGHLEAHLVDQPKTLAGSVAFLDECVRWLCEASKCGEAAALEAASLHPARLLSLDHRKGILSAGADADIIVLDNMLNVQATFIAGQLQWYDDHTSVPVADIK